MYLVEKYGKDDSLYPNDVKKRAIINQRILFLSGVLWARFFETYIMVKLYYNPMSHPSRSVLLLSRAIDLSLDLQSMDLMAGEHYTEDFLRMNPQHTIPLIADDEFYLSERAQSVKEMEQQKSNINVRSEDQTISDVDNSDTLPSGTSNTFMLVVEEKAYTCEGIHDPVHLVGCLISSKSLVSNNLGSVCFTDYDRELWDQRRHPPLVVQLQVILTSAAINIYLVEKYGKDDSLYPNDVEKRAIINQRLLFLSGALWARLFQTYIYPVCWQNLRINDLLMDKLDDTFNILNKYLDGHDWIAGDEISVADYTYAPIISCAEAIGYDVSKHDNVSLWLTRAKETMEDYEDLNQAGLDQFAGWFHEKLSKIESLDN